MSFKEYIGSIQTSLLSILGPTLPYKDTLSDGQSKAATALIDSASVPAGEVWEINNVYGYSSKAGNMAIFCTRGAISRQMNFKDATERIWWVGKILLGEGYHLRISTDQVGANMLVDTLGVKRYSPEALKELLHKTRPIPIKPDVQSPGPRPDPVM